MFVWFQNISSPSHGYLFLAGPDLRTSYPADTFFVLGFETHDNSSTPVAKLAHFRLRAPIPA